MSDPLSIAAGVVGILSAAAQISSLMIRFTKATKDAPAQARHIITEVSDTSGILSHLQSYLLRIESTEKSRSSLIKVDHVVTIVSGCVLTFSELEKILDELKADELSVLDCMKWARKESEVMAIITRLQNHKASLSLMLNVLHGDTLSEAKCSVDRLHEIVDKCYQEMSSRVQALELKELQRVDYTRSLATEKDSISDQNHSEIWRSSVDPDIAPTVRDDMVASDFWEELKRSWVYRRNSAFRNSTFSSDQQSLTWSYLSGLSMAEVSNISVINLAVTVEDVSNSQRVSQTWSHDSNFMEPSFTSQYPTTTLEQRADRETRHGPLAGSDDDNSSTMTVTELPMQGTSRIDSSGVSDVDRRRDSAGDLTRVALLGTVSLEPGDDLLTESIQTHWQKIFDPYDNSTTTKVKQAYDLDKDSGGSSCEGCGLTLDEGKTLEFVGNRWHIDCFKCHTCSTLPDSDLNMFLLEDGALICNICSYDCSVCGEKIEYYMAFLINDQAFCDACSKCRNCKSRIKDLKYVRTSQGIFCMSCHNDLRARKVKKERLKRIKWFDEESLKISTDKPLPSTPISAWGPSNPGTPSATSHENDTTLPGDSSK